MSSNNKPMPHNEQEMMKEFQNLGILKNPEIVDTNPRATLISHMYHSEKAQRSPFHVTMLDCIIFYHVNPSNLGKYVAN